MYQLLYFYLIRMLSTFFLYIFYLMKITITRNTDTN